MSIEKTEIKKAAYSEVGIKVEQLRDKAELEVSERRGSAKALKTLYQNILGGSTADTVEKDYMELLVKLNEREKELAEAEGREPGAVSPGPMDIIKFGLQYVQRAAHQAESAAVSEKNKALIAEGQLQSFEMLILSLKKDVDVAQAQIDRRLHTDEEGDAEHDNTQGARPDGVRPRGLKAQRLAEDKEPSPKVPVEALAPEPLPLKTEKVAVPKAISPTEVSVAPVGVKNALKNAPKNAPKRRKGKVMSRDDGNGVRK